MTNPRTPRTPPAAALARREFLALTGFAILAVHCLPATAHASGLLRGAELGTDALTIQSGPGAFHHVHYLRIPGAFLAAPPADGVELTTTKALLHRHRLLLTREDLRAVDQGGTVIQRASSHVFVIALAKGIAPQPGPGGV